MNLDDMQRIFVEEVKLRGFDTQYIDKISERELLKIAISRDFTLEAARSMLRQVCERESYAIESDLDQKAKELLDQFAHNDGHIDKKEFDDTVAVLYKAAKNRLSEILCRKKAKEIILANKWRVREGFMKGGNWFSNI